MTSSVRLHRSILAAALALATLPALAQDPTSNTGFSQTVFFGDSLTDSGHFRPALVQLAGPQAAVLGRFTTNPGLVWAEYLADFFGTGAVSDNQGGTDYAIGGARSGTDSTATLAPGFTLPVPSVTSQVSHYLASTGGHADPGALYSVWSGANDLFSITNPATAQAVIGGAVTSEIGAIGTLKAAGARYVLVTTVPDLGLTPIYRATGQSAAGTQLSAAYNAALFNGLTAAGLRVIPLDTFHLLQEIVASPTTYGITNVTGTACQPQITAQSLTCNPATYVNPNAPYTYAFADGVHPTTAAHALLAQYAISMIEAPGQIAVLPHSEEVVGRSRADRIGGHLAGKPTADGMRWWADLRGDFQRYGKGNAYDGAGPSLMGGVDWSSNRWVYGGFAGYGRQSIDWGGQRGHFDQSDASLGGFLGWYGDSAWVNGQVSYSRLRFDTSRDVQLGPATRTHRGSTGGRNLSAGINTGWDFTNGAWKHGPVASLLSQHIRVNGFAEDSPTLSTSLAYPQQTFNSLIGSVGWQARYTINEHMQPYARATFDREFRRADAEAFAQAQSIPGTMPYAVPGQQYDRSYGTLVLGTRTQVFGLDTNVGVSATIGQKRGDDATVFATVGSNF
jgi:outer membrane lipase/esterase